LHHARNLVEDSLESDK